VPIFPRTARYRRRVSYGSMPSPNPGFSQLEAVARQQQLESQGPYVERPSSFAVSATFPPAQGSRRSHCRGELLISSGAIVFTPFASPGRREGVGRFAHTASSVTVTTALLCPPWLNTSLLLQNRSSSVRVAAPVFARRKLRRALRAAGVTVQGETAWRAPQLPRG
jgi:hypothetical protein